MSVRTTVKSIQDIMRQDAGVDGDAQRISQLCWMFFLKIIDDQDQQLELMRRRLPLAPPAELRWRAWAADPEGITGDELLGFINDELFPELKEFSVAGPQGDRRRVVRDVFEDAYNYMKSGQLLRQVINKINEVDFNNLAERQHFGDIYEQILNDLQSAGNAASTTRRAPSPPSWPTHRPPARRDPPRPRLRHRRIPHLLHSPHARAIRQARRGRSSSCSSLCGQSRRSSCPTCSASPTCCSTASRTPASSATTTRWPGPTSATRSRIGWISFSPIRPLAGKEEDGIETNFPKHFQTRETADLFLALIIRLLKPDGRAAVVLPDGSLFGEGVKTRLKEQLMEECNLHTIVRLPNSVFKPYASIGTNLLFFEKGEPTKEIWYYEHRVPDGQKAYSMTRPIRVEHLEPCVDWWGGAKRKGRVETEVAWKVTIDEVKARGYNLDFKNPHTVADDHGDPEELLAKLERPRARPPRCATSSRPFWRRRCCDERRTAPRPFRPDQRGAGCRPAPAQFILDLAVSGKLVERTERRILQNGIAPKNSPQKAGKHAKTCEAHSLLTSLSFPSGFIS